jgi:hypothetical protein
MNNLTKWLKITNQYQKIDDDEKPSHLLLNGYKLYIKDENLEIFNKKYSEAIMNGDKLYIVECKKNIFKLFFDLDFLYSNENEKETEYSENLNNTFIEFIQIINNVIYDFYEKYYDCIVTTADIKKVKKICKNEENPTNINSKEFIKKGFHLHFPDIKVNKNMALEIRKTCIQRLTKYKDLFENSINDIIDEHVFTGSGLRLTGSRKGHFIAQTKEFVDEGRSYNLLYVLKNNEKDNDMLNRLNENITELIDKTTIISTDNYITNIKNNPNLDCEYCDETEQNEDNNQGNFHDGSSWKRLKKDDIRYIEILRFFNIYVKNYTIKDIKRIFYSENESIFILCSQSKYCTNIGKNHNSEHIYFKLNREGICQKCFCRCDTLDGRKHGYCKDFESEFIQCTPQLRKVLNFKEIVIDKTKILKNNKNNNKEINLNSLFDDLRNDWYNQFTNKEKLPSKRKYNKKSN